MQELPFWENVGRFMRFGVTSVTGLIAGLLAPFSVFLRTPTLAAIGASLAIGVLVFVYVTLTTMQGSPQSSSTMAVATPQQQQQQRSARPDATADGQVEKDPTMKQMLRDIYGDE